MSLTKIDRERITDSVLKIQSVSATLENMDETKVPEIVEIQNCLHTADKELRRALRA